MCLAITNPSPTRPPPRARSDIESIDALVEAIERFEGGVVIVSHDARLITETDCALWVCGNNTVTAYDGGFEDYRDELLRELEAAEAAAEAAAARKAAVASNARQERMRRLAEQSAAKRK